MGKGSRVLEELKRDFRMTTEYKWGNRLGGGSSDGALRGDQYGLSGSKGQLHQNHKPRDWCSEWWARLWYKNQDSREISGSILKNFYASKDHENFAGSLVI